MLKKLLAGSALLLAMSTSALAAPMYSFTGFVSTSGAGNFAQATEVQTSSAVVIDQIGFWAQSGILTQSHGLRIRDLTHGVDLFTGIILAGTGTLLNGFRYIDIADIAVAAGVRLAVMSDNRSGANTDLMAFDLTGLTFDPSVTLLGSSFQNDVGVSAYPFSQNFGGNVLAGANLLINTTATVVPEPGTLALFLLGMFGLARSKLTGRA